MPSYYYKARDVNGRSHEGIEVASSEDEVLRIVQPGYVSGTLDQIMVQTATYLEKAESLRLKVEAALRYPTFVLTFAGLVMIAMIVKIVPMFASIYQRFRVPLPLPTRILLGI